MRVTIVGAGVSGLTTAVALREAGWDTDVVARETYPSTVSAVAAAVWTAITAEPIESARRWALASRERFAALADDPGSGVVPLRQREFECVDPGPTWWETTPFVRRMALDELPAGYAAGFEVDGFMIEPALYLAWITDRLAATGVTVTQGELTSLDEVAGDLVVNCSGLGAATLAGDPTVRPIRGQVVAVPNPGIRDAVADESDQDRIAYVYPRSADVVLGGTRQAGSTDVAPDAATTERILAQCGLLDPRVRDLAPMAVRVGLRPGRPAVRVELDRLADGRPVIHDYGHAGAGFILSWGCALEVVALAATLR